MQSPGMNKMVESILNSMNKSNQINQIKMMKDKLNDRLPILIIGLGLWYYFTQPGSPVASSIRKMLKIKEESYMSSAVSYLLLVLPFLLIILSNNNINIQVMLPQMLLTMVFGTAWYHLTKPGSKLSKKITDKLKIDEKSLVGSLSSYGLYITPVMLILYYLLNVVFNMRSI